MPNPAKFKNTEKSYKKYMDECMHQTLHMERKEKDQSVAQCLNHWRAVHGPKRPGKAPKKVADLIREAAQSLKSGKDCPFCQVKTLSNLGNGIVHCSQCDKKMYEKDIARIRQNVDSLTFK